MNAVKRPLRKIRTSTYIWRNIRRDIWLYVMLLPGVGFFLLFKYLPMYGVIISFQNYMPFLGILGSKWVGLLNFHNFFNDPSFWQLFRNTFILAIYNLVFFFPMPIILSLILNEIRWEPFKRTIQTFIYLPHFISWPVVVGMCYVLLATSDGLINQLLIHFGINRIAFLTDPHWFRPLITLQVIWKETGWGTVIFLATLSGIDPQLYEAARIDGAGRWQQLCHITYPALLTTIVILLILRLGNFLDSGFEQIFLMLSSNTRDVGEVFDTYVYTTGLANGQLSYATAIGLFKSIVSLVLVISANFVAKCLGQEGVY
ncbi:MAG: protein lplB [Bacilli bacterium]|nr:protein lplB [Bacilli bacterium]